MIFMYAMFVTARHDIFIIFLQVDAWYVVRDFAYVCSVNHTM